MIDLVPRRVLDLYGVRLELRYTLAAVHRFEMMYGRGVKLNEDGCIPMAEFRALIWCMSDGRINQVEIGRLIRLPNIAETIGAVVALVSQSTKRVEGLGGSDSPEEEAATIDWIELWAIARVDMNLTTEEFWNLTPHMFQRLLLRVRRKYGVADEESKENQVAGILRKVEMLNAAMGGKDLRGVSINE